MAQLHHLPHLPHPGHIPRVPHVHLRSVGHDALVAAELALAAVVLTGSIDGGSISDVVDAPSASITANTPPAAQVADAASAVEASADLVPTVSVSVIGTGMVAHVYVPSSGSSRIALTDATNITVTTVVIGQPTTRISNLPGGEYRILVTNEGAVETVGDAAISSSVSVRSPAIVIRSGDVLTVVQDAAG